MRTSKRKGKRGEEMMEEDKEEKEGMGYDKGRGRRERRGGRR